MKRWFLFFIVGLLALISIFLILDSIFFHFIFKQKPGSCLILEEKYCQQSQPIYSENKELLGINYKLPNGSKIFSPIDGEYNRNIVEGQQGQKHEKGYLIFKYTDSQISLDSNKKYWYEFVLKNIKSNKKIEKGTFNVKKGDILGYIDTDNLNDFNLFVVVKNGVSDELGTKQVVNIEETNRIVNPNLK